MMDKLYCHETQKPLLLFIDSDCAIKEDGVQTMTRCMLEERNPPYQALAGHVKVYMGGADAGYNWWWKLQEADFIISQMMVRGAEESLGGVTCLPGAFCMMRWEAFEREGTSTSP